jgi:hypothetical protein
MSPGQDPSTVQRNQEIPKKKKRKEAARRPRSRKCLLKGCGNNFRPAREMARYCSDECRKQARLWSQWKSRQRYRQSEKGREKRQQQSERYRQQMQVGRQANREEGARGSSPSITVKIFFRRLL